MVPYGSTGSGCSPQDGGILPAISIHVLSGCQIETKSSTTLQLETAAPKRSPESVEEIQTFR